MRWSSDLSRQFQKQGIPGSLSLAFSLGPIPNLGRCISFLVLVFREFGVLDCLQSSHGFFAFPWHFGEFHAIHFRAHKLHTHIVPIRNMTSIHFIGWKWPIWQNRTASFHFGTICFRNLVIVIYSRFPNFKMLFITPSEFNKKGLISR